MDHGKRSAFTVWYLSEVPGTVRTVTLALGDPELAQEVTAEAYARAWQDWERVSTMASPGGWVYQVALNLTRSRIRRLRLERRHARTNTTSIVAPSPSAPDEALWKAVAELPPRARFAIALRYIADLPEADIATVMGISRGTVASTLGSARRRLAEVLTSDPQGVFDVR